MSLQALQQGNTEGARIYASNAIRKKHEALNLLRLSSRIDAVASRVETAVTMRQVTGNMTSVVRGMDKATDSMNLERVSTGSILVLYHLYLSPVDIACDGQV
jgi:charged multivesicular body protein 1